MCGKKHCLCNALFVLLVNSLVSLLSCRHIFPEAVGDANILTVMVGYLFSCLSFCIAVSTCICGCEVM